MVSQGCQFLLELQFLGFQILVSFLGKFGPKSHICSIWLKIGTQSVSTMLILIPTLFFSVSNPKFFLNKFGSKISNLFILTENWHIWYIEDADSYSHNSFLNCQSQIYFWANLDWKSQSCLLCLKTGTHAHTHTVSRRC